MPREGVAQRGLGRARHERAQLGDGAARHVEHRQAHEGEVAADARAQRAAGVREEQTPEEQVAQRAARGDRQDVALEVEHLAQFPEAVQHEAREEGRRRRRELEHQ